MLDNDDAELIGDGYCPDCGNRGFVLGPRGGASINIECANNACRARFNVTPLPHSHRPAFVERIPKQSEGGSDWG